MKLFTNRNKRASANLNYSLLNHLFVVSDLCAHQVVIDDSPLSCQITNNIEYYNHGWRWRIEQKFGIEPKGTKINVLSLFWNVSNYD